MARRDKALRAYLASMQRGDAGATEDPFAGVPPQLAETHLYGVTGGTWWNGWDGEHAGRIKIHRDGHHTSHTGACAIEPAEEPVERVIRQHGLEYREAEYLRDRIEHPADKLPARAARLRIPERTLRRLVERLQGRLAGLLRESME